jgi:hypothetical protein
MNSIRILTFCLLWANLSFTQNDSLTGWDKIFRTSDLDGEVPTQANRRHWKGNVPKNLPDGSERVGCVCMNGAVRPTVGTGSCNGRGGVRFWLIKTPNGDTIQQPTIRHEGSPDYDPEKFVGPNPQPQPIVVVLSPNTADSLYNPRFYPPSVNGQAGRTDTQVILLQTPTAATLQAQQPVGSPSFMGDMAWLAPVMNFSSVTVICLTVAYILKLILSSPSDKPSFQVIKRIRLTLVKILFRGNRMGNTK